MTRSPRHELSVDVLTAVDIDCRVAAVAAFAADPSNAPEWYANIESIAWKTEPPLRTGSVVAFRARFLGRHLDYTYEIAEFLAGERLVMRTREGPFPMETTYTWSACGANSTHMTLRNRGEASGFSRFAMPLMVPAMRRANRKDLARLKGLLEQRPE
jgi:hypothetical protein